MKKEITYARLKAEQRLKQGRKPSTLKLVFNPPIYFLRIFFWNRFFLSGWAGFIHAGDRRHVFSHDRIDPSAVVLRANGALTRFLFGGDAIGRGGMSREFDDEALDALEVIIPNLNWRYSGGTAVNRTIAPLIAKRWRAAWCGPDRPEGIAALSLGDLVRLRFRPPTHGKVRIWHARRNVEMLAGLFLNLHRLSLCADLQFGLPAQENLADPLSHRANGCGDRDERDRGAISAAPGDGHPSRHRRRSLFPARRPPRGLRENRPARKIRDRNVRPRAKAERQRPVRRGDVPPACRNTRISAPWWSGSRPSTICPLSKGSSSEIAAAGLTERIRFLGELPIEEVPLWYQRISIYVFASRVEGFGLTMLEAMAAGDAVVATRAGAAEMIITDGDDGVLAPVDDVEALVAALEPLMREPERIEAMGRRARERVVSAFSRDREADEISDVYRQIWAVKASLARPPSPAGEGQG